MRKLLLGLGFMMLVGCVAWAAVTNDPVKVTIRSGITIDLPLKLTSTQAVAGVNGELSYDATVFSNPQIMQGAGSLGFTVLGNAVSPGKYRFVVYADPTANLKLDTPVVFFRFNVAFTPHRAFISNLTYSQAAAGSAEGASLDTSFSPMQISINSAAVEDWAIYE